MRVAEDRPLVATRTGSTTSGQVHRAVRATSSTTAGVPSMPVFTAATGQVVEDGVDLGVDDRGGTGCTAWTPVVSWAVTAVTTQAPWHAEVPERRQVGRDPGGAPGVGAGDSEDHAAAASSQGLMEQLGDDGGRVAARA